MFYNAIMDIDVGIKYRLKAPSYPALREAGRRTVTPLQFIDFFAGVGLAELGLVPPWVCVWANDIDPKKKLIYDANFDSSRYLLADVEKITIDDLPSSADMAWASFPCQDLSLAGWRRGLSAKRSGTFWAFHRLMAQLHQQGRRPPLIVVENVTGLLHGEDFAGLCEALAALDMQFGALVMDARHFLPQSRPRVFLVAVDNRINVEAFTRPLPGSSDWFPKSLVRAWERLPDSTKHSWRWWNLPIPHQPIPSVDEIIEEIPSNVSWHSAEETKRLLSLMSQTNLDKIERARSASGRSIGFLYRRTRNGGQRAEVRFDGVAGCLRTTYGGSSRQTVVVVERGQVRSRLLSPREAARLMGVPDTFELPASYNENYRAMGDGVAVPVVKWLAANLVTPLALTAKISTCGLANSIGSKVYSFASTGPASGLEIVFDED